jgi:4-hydroxy-3-methylbut-2-enyl diphosphate reductase
MIVIGGYNSSNTNNLARIASNFTTAFHIEDAAAIISPDQIRHKPVGSKKEVIGTGWFPASTTTIGITAGASTPNNQIGEAIERIAGFRGTMTAADILGVH